MVALTNVLGASPSRPNRTSRVGVVSRFGVRVLKSGPAPVYSDRLARTAGRPETTHPESRCPRTDLHAGSVRNGESDVQPHIRDRRPKRRPPASSLLRRT